MKLKSYFRRELNDSRIMLGKSDGGWYITCKRIVDGNDKPEILQTIKQRNGKSIMTTTLHISDKSMEELVFLHDNHPSKLKILTWKLRKMASE